MTVASSLTRLTFQLAVKSDCGIWTSQYFVNVLLFFPALLFSATFKKRIEKLCREILIDPIRVVIGELGEVNIIQ